MTAAPAVLASTAAQLDARLATAQADGHVPSLVAAVVREGAIGWTGQRGRAVRRGSDERPDADTQYRIGSITKTMTAVLVLQLRDHGRIDLADPLSVHLPEAAFGDRSIRSLLAHASGLPAEPPGPWWERSPGPTWAGLSEAVADISAVLPAGRQHHYSNLGYALLGQLVASLHGCTWAKVLQGQLLDPLGMSRTTYRAQVPAAAGFSVHPYAGTLTDEPAHDTGAMAPAGQLWSTATDLGAWVRFLTAPSSEILAADTLEEMTIIQSADPGAGLRDAYGLGLRLLEHRGTVLVGHTGSMPGFLAAVFAERRAGVGSVVLANTTRGLDVAGLAGDLITTVLEREPPLTAEWLPNDDVGATGELLGPWYWGNTPFAMSLGGELLMLAGAAADRPTRFRLADTDAYLGLDGYFTGETLQVFRRGTGEISHLELATFVLTRTPYDPVTPIPGQLPTAD